MRLREQFAKPEGIFGYLVDWLMLKFNRNLNAWAIKLLKIRDSDSILEIGFGPGQAVREISARIEAGRVAGVDISPLMVKQAKKRNAEAIREGKVNLHESSVEELPFEDAGFHKVFSVNSIQFWKSPPDDLGEVRRVLQRGGRFVVVLQDRGASSIAGVKLNCRKFIDALEKAGFIDIRHEIRIMSPVPALAITAINP